MALPDFIKNGVGTPIIFGNATAHNGSVAANNNLGDITIEMDCSDLIAGEARQSVKFDLGEFWDIEWVFSAVLEWEVTPEVANTDTFQWFFGWSPSTTAAVANSANLTGVDAAYAGYTAGSLDASLKQLGQPIVMPQDNVITTDQTQIGIELTTIRPGNRYGQLVAFNGAASAALHSDMVEMSFMLAPKVLQVRDTA